MIGLLWPAATSAFESLGSVSAATASYGGPFAVRAVEPVVAGSEGQAKVELFLDRVRYESDDGSIHALVQAPLGRPSVPLSLCDAEGRCAHSVLSNETGAVEFRWPLDGLAPGRYTLAADVVVSRDFEVSEDFELSEGSEVGAPLPAQSPTGSSATPSERAVRIPLRVIDPAWGDPGRVDAAGEVDGPRRHRAPLRWPVRGAVPLPRGFASSVESLRIVDADGGAIPRAALTPISRWAGPGSSLRWVAVDLVAEWREGSWREVSLERFVRERLPHGAAPSPLAVGTPPSAWGDPYTVDRAGRRAEPEEEAVWRLSQANGVVRCWRRSGWLVDDRGLRHARFSAHLREYGVVEGDATTPAPIEDAPFETATFETARVEVEPSEARGFEAAPSMASLEVRVILTAETLERGLIDAGWEIAIDRGGGSEKPVEPATWSGALDHEELRGEGPVSFLQDRADRCSAHVGDAPRMGIVCGGWLSVSAPSEGGVERVRVALQGFRERFPKEIEWTGESLIAHLWPGQSAAAFTEEEELARRHLHELRFAHQGPELALALPERYAARLRELHEEPGPDRGWDAESSVDRALSRGDHGMGMALTGELWLWRSSDGGADSRVAAPESSSSPWRSERWRSERALAASPPILLPAPEAWSASGVEVGSATPPTGEWSDALRRGLPAYRRFLRRGPRDYGQWIYGGVHNRWDPERVVPELHRVWQASHYRNVSEAWRLALATADPELVAWARETSRQFRDVHVLHHPTAFDPIGAIDHCKGFLPWAARSSVWGHWIDPDALRLREILLGDEISGELYRAWADALIGARMHLGADREGVNTLGELVAYYRETGDARALVSIDEWSETILAKPFERWRSPGTFPSWHGQWMERLYALRRDERLVERTLSWIEAGHTDPAALALLERVGVGEAVRAESVAARGSALSVARQRFDAPGDPLDGYSAWWSNAASRELARSAARGPRSLDRKLVRTAYPAAPTYSVERGRGRGAGLEVWVLDEGDRAIELELRRPRGFGDLGPIHYRWVSPSGVELASGTTRLDAPEGVTIRTPPDGDEGLYRFECRGYRCQLLAPLSDRTEVAALHPGSEYRALGPLSCALSPADPVALEVTLAASPGTTPSFPSTATPAAYELLSPGAEEPAARGSLFAFGEPSEVRLDLAATARGEAHALTTDSRFGPSIEVDGETPYVLLRTESVSAEEVAKIVRRAGERHRAPAPPNRPLPTCDPAAVSSQCRN